MGKKTPNKKNFPRYQPVTLQNPCNDILGSRLRHLKLLFFLFNYLALILILGNLIRRRDKKKIKNLSRPEPSPVRLDQSYPMYSRENLL